MKKHIKNIIRLAAIVLLCIAVFILLNKPQGSSQEIAAGGCKEFIEPQSVKFDIGNTAVTEFSDYLKRTADGEYSYSNLEDLENDLSISILKPHVDEYDKDNEHVYVYQGSSELSIQYYIGRKRENEKEPYQYLTRVDGFITLTSEPEPVFPGNSDKQLLDEYNAASVDYWDSLEYYNINILAYTDASMYEETRLLNNDIGEITYNETLTNAAGIEMIVRGYEKAYDPVYKKYTPAMTNPYVSEDYRYYEACFAYDNKIYTISGRTGAQSFINFLNEFGEDR